MDALRAAGVRAVSPNGVLGDPLGATADEGEQLLKSLSSELLAVVSRWMLDRWRDRACRKPGTNGSTRSPSRCIAWR
jgi:hypothetical protein